MRYVCRPGKNAGDKLLPPDDREEESGRRPGTLFYAKCGRVICRHSKGRNSGLVLTTELCQSLHTCSISNH